MLHEETGELTWLRGTAHLTESVDGSWERIFGIATDITTEKRAKEQASARSHRLDDLVRDKTSALEYSERRYRAIFEASLDPLILLNEEGQIIEASASVSDLLGYTPDDVRGEHFLEFMPQEHSDEVRKIWTRAVAGESVRFRFPLLHADGTEVLAEFSAAQLKIDQDILVMAVVRDLRGDVELRSKLSEAKERLERADTLELIGRLAGGVAHDLNNMLSVILSTAQILEQSVSDPTLAEDASEITLAAQTAASLSRRLLHFGRTSPTTRGVDFSGALAELEPFIENLLPTEIEWTTNVESGLPEIDLRAMELEQILLNLILNARDAIDGTGEIELTARSSSMPSYGLLLEVRDNGGGIDPELTDRIFEPLFSTKGKSGTGMGLATVARIVDEAGGTREVRTEPGSGTRFLLQLPAKDSVGHDLGDQTTEREVRQLDLDVLVVDDTEPVVHYLERALASEGCDVTGVSSANDAWEHIQAGSGFDVVIADVHMPGMSGVELLQKMRDEDIDIPVVFITADPSFDLPEMGAELIYKPFTPTQLNTSLSQFAR